VSLRDLRSYRSANCVIGAATFGHGGDKYLNAKQANINITRLTPRRLFNKTVPANRSAISNGTGQKRSKPQPLHITGFHALRYVSFRNCPVVNRKPPGNRHIISLVAIWQAKRSSNLMSIIALIVSGLIIGVIAKLLMPGRDPGGFIITILLGIAGMFLGSYIGRAFGFYKPDEPAGWIVSILGALVLLALYHMLFIRRSTHRFF
jgi:uncharacterized membrane protein YeaQ/YmgE (transglycosylase-associated protein family)